MTHKLKKEIFGIAIIFMLVCILLNVLLVLPIMVEGDKETTPITFGVGKENDSLQTIVGGES